MAFNRCAAQIFCGLGQRLSFRCRVFVVFLDCRRIDRAWAVTSLSLGKKRVVEGASSQLDQLDYLSKDLVWDWGARAVTKRAGNSHRVKSAGKRCFPLKLKREGASVGNEL